MLTRVRKYGELGVNPGGTEDERENRWMAWCDVGSGSPDGGKGSPDGSIVCAGFAPDACNAGASDAVPQCWNARSQPGRIRIPENLANDGDGTRKGIFLQVQLAPFARAWRTVSHVACRCFRLRTHVPSAGDGSAVAVRER